MMLIKFENKKTILRIAVFLIALGILISLSGQAGNNTATAYLGLAFSFLSVIGLLCIYKDRIYAAKVLWAIGTPILIFAAPCFFPLHQPTSLISYSYLYMGGMLFCGYSLQDKSEKVPLWISIVLFFLAVVFYDRVMIGKNFSASPYAAMFEDNYLHFKLTQLVHFATLIYLVVQIQSNKVRIEKQLSKQIEKLKHFASTLIYTSKNKLINSGNLIMSLEEILRTTAKVLDVSRISVWEINEEENMIHTMVSYDYLNNEFTYSGELSKEKFPVYFKYLLEEKIIATSDAVKHEKTMEFAQSYLLPLGIQSMMDSPFFIDGKIKGILCCEEQRTPREWDEIDQLFSLAISKLISISYYCMVRKEQYAAILKTSEELQRKNETMESIHQKMTEANGTLANSLFWKEEEKKEFQKIINEFSFKNAHDVRGPLSRILGLIQVYKDDPDQENKKLYISYMEKSANELDAIIREIALILNKNVK